MSAIYRSMRVTPRLPVHGAYLQSPFLEMRYFRFDGASFAAALLFAILDEASAFQEMLDVVTKKADNCGNEGKGLILLSTSITADRKHIHEAWNNQQTAVLEALTGFELYPLSKEETFGKCLPYGIHPIQYTAQFATPPNLVPVYYDCPADGSVVLLYSNYDMDSFVITPCGHMYVKAELYRMMREAMKRPMNGGEIVKVNVQCKGANCGFNLQHFTFGTAKTDATCCVEASIHSLTRCKSARGCLYCGSSDAKALCVQNCPMCIPCSIRISFTKYRFSCPFCSARFQPACMNAILQAREAVIGVLNTEFINRCPKCKAERGMEEFRYTLGSSHKCWICDICLFDVQIGPSDSHLRCPHCNDNFEADRVEIIRQMQLYVRKAESTYIPKEMEDVYIVCVLCGEAKLGVSFRTYLRNEHRCAICDRCHKTKVVPLQQCLLCSSRFAPAESMKSSYACDGCKMIKQCFDFSIFLYIQHPCKVCNLCFASSLQACSACFALFSDRDSAIVSTKCGELECKRCGCGNAINRGAYSCARGCFCSACHFRRILLHDIVNCPTCNSPNKTKVPKGLRCSKCLREVKQKRTESVAISGICRKGHMLCQHCVQVADTVLLCSICYNEVQSNRSLSELRAAQNELIFACYCGRNSEKIEPLTCGHYAHRKCSASLPACRICGEPLREKEEEVTIWKYVK